jgi:heat shock protein HtpX
MPASPPDPAERYRRGRVSRLGAVLVGLAAFGFYGLLAAASLGIVLAVWQIRLDPVAAVAGLLIGTIIAAFLSLRIGTRRVLSTLAAREVPKSRLPRVYAMLEDLAASMSIESPRLLVARLESPNAFALETGGQNTVVLDASLFRLLDGPELEALLAHELAHLERRDGFLGSIALALSQLVIVVLELVLSPAVFLLTGTALCVAWIRGDPRSWSATLPGRIRGRIESGVALVGMTVTLLIRAYARRREFGADERAAEVTGRPLALASALTKIDRAAAPRFGSLSPVWTHGEVESEEERRLRQYVSTHPPTEDRVSRLQKLAERSASEARGE